MSFDTISGSVAEFLSKLRVQEGVSSLASTPDTNDTVAAIQIIFGGILSTGITEISIFKRTTYSIQTVNEDDYTDLEFDRCPTLLEIKEVFDDFITTTSKRVVEVCYYHDDQISSVAYPKPVYSSVARYRAD